MTGTIICLCTAAGLTKLSEKPLAFQGGYYYYSSNNILSVAEYGLPRTVSALLTTLKRALKAQV
ncbi:MAG: hypothetical protein GY941_06245 [Planctomycetes bacterium]|nr:hypothetical protein [Planctomycetota bacterium]